MGAPLRVRILDRLRVFQRSLIVVERPIVLILFLGVILTNLTGCNNPHPIVHRMESAFSVRKSQEDVSKVIQSLLPLGSDLKAASALFLDLQKDGFVVKEYTRHGVRAWPSGALLQYTDSAMRKQMENRLQLGVSEYVLEVVYSPRIALVSKTASIVVQVKDQKVMAVSGRINVSSI